MLLDLVAVAGNDSADDDDYYDDEWWWWRCFQHFKKYGKIIIIFTCRQASQTVFIHEKLGAFVSAIPRPKDACLWYGCDMGVAAAACLLSVYTGSLQLEAENNRGTRFRAHILYIYKAPRTFIGELECRVWIHIGWSRSVRRCIMWQINYILHENGQGKQFASQLDPITMPARATDSGNRRRPISWNFPRTLCNSSSSAVHTYVERESPGSGGRPLSSRQGAAHSVGK